MNVYVFEKGSVSPIPNSENWEKQYQICLHYVSTDKNANQLFAEKKPDVFISVGTSCEAYPVLYALPLYIRKRWLHMSDKDAIFYWQIERCSSNARKAQVGPCISVFTTAYESGDRILRPYNSLRAQVDMPEWEWVIMDDSKTNDTWNTHLKRLAKQDCRIRIFRSEFNDGFIGSVKRNAAMLCRGDYLVELDHDDELLPNALSALVRGFKSDETIGMIGSDCIELFEKTLANWNYGEYYGFGFHSYYKLFMTDADGSNGRWVNVARNGPLNKFTLRHIVGVLNHVRAWRRTTYYELNGHDFRLNVCDDYDLILRTFLSKKYRIAKLPELLYKQYRNEGGNNFTFLRNAYIQKLVKVLRNDYDDAIHERLLELKMDDDGGTYKANANNTKMPQPEKCAFLSWQYNPSADVVLDVAPGRIAVVMPTFNRPKLVLRAIRSVLAQTFTNWVLYVIGDKCPVLDNIMKRKKWLHNDPRIRYWNLETNCGEGSFPRNYALQTLVTDKEDVAYLDDDNMWEPNHLQSLKHAMQNAPNKPTFAFSSFVFEEGGKECMKILCTEPKLYRIDTSCLLHKYELFAKYNFWRSDKIYGYAIDWDLVKRWVAANEPWVATKLFTLRYNNNKQNMQGIHDAYDDQHQEEKEGEVVVTTGSNNKSQDDEDEEEDEEKKETTTPKTVVVTAKQTFERVIQEEPISVTVYPITTSSKPLKEEKEEKKEDGSSTAVIVPIVIKMVTNGTATVKNDNTPQSPTYVEENGQNGSNDTIIDITTQNGNNDDDDDDDVSLFLKACNNIRDSSDNATQTQTQQQQQHHTKKEDETDDVSLFLKACEKRKTISTNIK